MGAEGKWKSDAVVRLLLSVIICVCAGSVLGATASFSVSAGEHAFRFYTIGSGALACLAATLWLVNSDWPTEAILRRLALALLLFYSGLFAGAWMHKEAGTGGLSVVQMVLSALSFHGAILGLTPVFLTRQGKSWREGFGFANNPRPSLIAGIVLALIFLPLGLSLQHVSAVVIEHLHRFGISAEEQASVQTLRVASSWAARATLGVVTILLAPVAEEVLFRGVLYSWIKQAGLPRLALWGTSLLFAAVHFNAVTFVPLLLLSLLLTLIYESTANLAAPIAAHATFNGINFAMLYLLSR
jgi:membrane protease YdiL (CAAX protease family)